MLTVQHILDKKKDVPVARIGVDDSVLDAARIMNERHIGALIVAEKERVIGIFTERDILNRVVAKQKNPADTIVKDVMTAPVACCKSDTPLTQCRSVMKSKRIRHLPVVEKGKLLGMISIGDILEDEFAEQGETIRYLHDYLYGGDRR